MVTTDSCTCSRLIEDWLAQYFEFKGNSQESCIAKISLNLNDSSKRLICQETFWCLWQIPANIGGTITLTHHCADICYANDFIRQKSRLNFTSFSANASTSTVPERHTVWYSRGVFYGDDDGWWRGRGTTRHFNLVIRWNLSTTEVQAIFIYAHRSSDAPKGPGQRSYVASFKRLVRFDLHHNIEQTDQKTTSKLLRSFLIIKNITKDIPTSSPRSSKSERESQSIFTPLQYCIQ